jgi:hypothetical protein
LINGVPFEGYNKCKRTSHPMVPIRPRKVTGIDKSTLVLQFNFPTKYRLTLFSCMAVVETKPHHMDEFQPMSLLCCEEQEERVSEFDPSQGPMGLSPTLFYSRSTKKGAIKELFGRVRV